MTELSISLMNTLCLPLIVLTLILFIKCKISSNIRRHITTIDTLILALFFNAFISYLIYEVEGTAGTDLIVMFTGIMMYIAVRCKVYSDYLLVYIMCGTVIFLGIGVYQVTSHVNLDGGMLNRNHYACFLATVAPIAIGSTLEAFIKTKHFVKDGNILNMKIFILLSLCLISTVTIVLLLFCRCRTAIVAIIASLSIMGMILLTNYFSLSKRREYIKNQIRRLKVFYHCFIFCLLITSLISLCTFFFFLFTNSNKALSVYGRLMIWNVGFNIASDNLIGGIGFGNLAKQFNIYQATYFLQNNVSVPQMMAADQIRHVFSEPLEVAIEFGIGGLILIIIFTLFILNYIWKAFTSIWRNERSNCLTMGMACGVLVFIFLSIVHFPRKIAPTFILFNISLGWIVNSNSNKVIKKNLFNENDIKTKYSRWIRISICLIICILSVPIIQIYSHRYIIGLKWKKAYSLSRAGNFASAYPLYKEAFTTFSSCGRFLSQYGNVFMGLSLNTNMSLSNTNQCKLSLLTNAIELYETAIYTYPDPYMFENLAVAYIRSSNYTNNLYFADARQRKAKPVLSLLNNIYDRSNELFKTQFVNITREECIIRSIRYMTLSSNILPWRLSPKYYLANIYNNIGETNNAIKYAKLVVNTPMKKYTERGVEMKKSAQNMLNELGVPCDDPGIIVFDIHDRSTWNEGKW